MYYKLYVDGDLFASKIRSAGELTDIIQAISKRDPHCKCTFSFESYEPFWIGSDGKVYEYADNIDDNHLFHITRKLARGDIEDYERLTEAMINNVFVEAKERGLWDSEETAEAYHYSALYWFEHADKNDDDNDDDDEGHYDDDDDDDDDDCCCAGLIFGVVGE